MANPALVPIPPVDVTPATLAWREVDISAHVPAIATGAILHLHANCALDGGINIALRKKGSADDDHLRHVRTSTHQWALIGIDASKIFEAWIGQYLGGNVMELWLVGYTTDQVTFFTNYKDYSIDPGTGLWVPVDVSADCPGAVAIIFRAFSLGGPGAWNLGFRKSGSSDNRFAVTGSWAQLWPLVGCDDSQIVEVYVEFEPVFNRSEIDLKVLGYITGGIEMRTNGADKSLTTTGSYETIDCSAEAPGAAMLIFEVLDDYPNWRRWALRKNGSAEDIYRMAYWHHWAVLECDAGQIVEGQIENEAVDFFLMGYPARPPSGYSQAHVIG